MSSQNVKEKIEDICENVDHNEQVKLLEQITAEIAAYIRQENNDNDYTDSAFDLLSNLAESAVEDFEELIGVDRTEKVYSSTSKIFALLLNTNVSSVQKIKRIIKIAIETTIKIWQEP